MSSGARISRIQAHHDTVSHSSTSQHCNYELYIARRCEDGSPRKCNTAIVGHTFCIEPRYCSPQSPFHQHTESAGHRLMNSLPTLAYVRSKSGMPARTTEAAPYSLWGSASDSQNRHRCTPAYLLQHTLMMPRHIASVTRGQFSRFRLPAGASHLRRAQ